LQNRFDKMSTENPTEEAEQLVTSELIVEILKKVEKTEKIEILEFATRSAVEKGENWSSTLIR
jgi:hypothetical protein